jgi:hypothetical protein
MRLTLYLAQIRQGVRPPQLSTTRKSVKRFYAATTADGVCAEIMLNQRIKVSRFRSSLMQKSA